MSGVWDYIVSNAPEKMRIEVPEWGPEGEPFVGYATVATVSDEVRVRRMVKDADSPETWARLVFNKLVDEDGSRCFKGVGFADFQTRVHAGLSRRIGVQIYSGSVIEVSEAEGN